MYGLLVIAALFVIGACATSSAIARNQSAKPYDGFPSGEGKGRAWGYNGWINVDIVMDKGWIRSATVTGGETPTIGAPVVQNAADLIMKKNSVEIDIITCATMSSLGVINAGKQVVEAIYANQSK